ncbi:hypothetical protein [Bosea thiooxidans]|nr:hypothetical protein [Bosea thiooxidans]
MSDRKEMSPGNGVPGPSFDRRTTDAVIAAVENEIALPDAELVKAGNGGKEATALSDKKARLQGFLADYAMIANDYHGRLARGAQPVSRSLWKQLLDRLKLG